jgi:GLPGLI family protein
MKSGLILILIGLTSGIPVVKGQKVLSEGTLIYDISVVTNKSNENKSNFLDGATNTIYLHGDKIRTEMNSSLGSEATIYNSTSRTGVILKNYSGQKLMITLTANDWRTNNSKFEGVTFENTGETKDIAGFKCIRAIGKFSDGSTFTVFYDPDIIIGNKDYDFQFRNLPGLPVQYEMQKGRSLYKFTLSKINYENVPDSEFEIPKSGYRIMTYQEAKKY